MKERNNKQSVSVMVEHQFGVIVSTKSHVEIQCGSQATTLYSSARVVIMPPPTSWMHPYIHQLFIPSLINVQR
jgi:hypothetical protein